MMNDSEIVFDPNSGISEEEQHEILQGINSIAEKNRRSLSGSSVNKSIKAIKKGGLFPGVVNAAAVLFLAGGFFLLYSAHGKEDVQLRQGTRMYNTAERALIDEIRRETSAQIEEKENEISLVVSQMEDVDLQLRNLHSNNLELTAEQLALEENLKRMQEEYSLDLANLQNERSRILERSRAREASLQAQLEARTSEMSALSERSEAALSSAYSQLENLRGEQEKAAAVEAQLGAYFQVTSEHIRNNRLTEASDTLATMRLFLNTPSFRELRSIQARKEVYSQSISLMEVMVEEARKTHEAAARGIAGADSAEALNELVEKNAQLEETIAGLNRTLSAVNSQGSDIVQRLTELEESAATLRTLNDAMETSISEQQQTIAEMESQNAGLVQTVTARENVIRELETENNDKQEQIASLDTQLSSLKQMLQMLSE